MTLQTDAPPVHDDRHPVPPYHTPRLRLKPKAAPTGYVDGAWWPNSSDLLEELPDLVAVLSVRLGTIGRVVYGLSEWDTVPSKSTIDGRVVRLDGFNRQPPNTVEVLGVDGAKVILLVVPPETSSDQAHTTMMAAATLDDATAVEGLLAMGA